MLQTPADKASKTVIAADKDPKKKLNVLTYISSGPACETQNKYKIGPTPVTKE
jgi:hypothetical protein